MVGFFSLANSYFGLGTGQPGRCIDAFAFPEYAHGASAADNLSKKPCGSFSNRVTAEALQNPQVTGAIIAVDWRVISKSQGTFNWSAVDTALRQAKKAHKSVMLSLVAGGASTPDWVKKMPGVKLIYIVDTNEYHKTYCRRVSMPVFWNEAFLREKESFIAEAGKKYGNNPNVLGVTVSFANAFTNDWFVPHEVGRFCGRNIDQVRDWLNRGYTTDKMVDAGKRTIDAWARAFPIKTLRLPIQMTDEHLDGTASNLAERIIDYAYAAYPDTFYAQLNSLNAATPYANSSQVINADPNTYGYILKLMTQHPEHIGLQMLAAASNGSLDNCRQNAGVNPCPAHDVLLESVERGLSYKPAYIEYWREDVENKDLQDVLEYANHGMNSCSDSSSHDQVSTSGDH
jgi:hypothetical protein